MIDRLHRPSHETDTVEACGKTVTVNYFGDFASDSQFFVAAGVLVMLYAAVSFAYYVFRDDTYLSNKSVPLAVITDSHSLTNLIVY